MATRNEVEPPPEPAILTEIKTVVGLAKQGDVSVLPRLRELLADYPAIWKHYGDLAAHAEMAWANLAAGPNLHLRECLLLQAAALREELGGSSPSPLERLLVERVVATWLQLHFFDTIEAQSLSHEEMPRLAGFRAKRQEQAHRMYLTALAALTTLRKLLPSPTNKVLPSRKDNDSTCPERNGHHRNGHAADLPPGVNNRLADFFESRSGAQEEGQREQEICSAPAGE